MKRRSTKGRFLFSRKESEKGILGTKDPLNVTFRKSNGSQIINIYTIFIFIYTNVFLIACYVPGFEQGCFALSQSPISCLKSVKIFWVGKYFENRRAQIELKAPDFLAHHHLKKHISQLHLFDWTTNCWSIILC